MMNGLELTGFLRQSKYLAGKNPPPEDLVVSGVSIDSRTIRPGELFIAIVGEKFDGHQFIEQAIQKGAAGIVHRESWHNGPSDKQVPCLAATDTLNFLMELAGWYRSRFTMPVIAVTGSTGKTTSKEMLSAVLKQKYQVYKTPGNLNNFIGTSLTLLGLQKSIEAAIIEIGTNHPGEIGVLARMVDPTHAAITNIGSGHIGFFGSRQAIFKEKTALFNEMREDSHIFINTDDPYLSKYQNSRRVAHTFGMKDGSDFQGNYEGLNEQGCAKLRINNGPEIQLTIPGRHQVSNALLAGAVGLELGVSPQQIKKGLESTVKTDKRMEMIRVDGTTIINDAYNANPESMRAAIDFISEMPRKQGAKKIAVLGDMLELGAQSEHFHRKVGQYTIGKGLDIVYCLGEDSRFIIEELRNGSSGDMHFEFFDTYEQVVQELHRVLQQDDIVLLKGSRGMALENIINLLQNKD